jgi:hypothetical protein
MTTIRPPRPKKGYGSAKALVVEMFVEDAMVAYSGGDSGRVGDLCNEIELYFGEGATDRTADFVTGNRMTSVEAVVWAATEWKQCKRVLRGKEI